jgi:hypothetical protein
MRVRVENAMATSLSASWSARRRIDGRATPRLDFGASEPGCGEGLEQLEPAGLRRGRPIGKTRKIFHDHVNVTQTIEPP